MVPAAGIGPAGSYRLERLLGRGASGEVWEARSPFGPERLAVKCVDLSSMKPKERELAAQEAQLLRRISHPHIVRFVDLVTNGHHICIVMPFLEGGDLTKVVTEARELSRRLPEVDIWRWFLQIASALLCLHTARIIHRDVKPANIFLAGGDQRAVLGDLGIAKVLRHVEAGAMTQIGTPAYLAPEVWLGRLYDYAADVYSLGCTVYELAELRMPFVAENGVLPLQVCRRRSTPISQSSGYSPALRNVVQLMLDRDPKVRPGPSAIISYAKRLAQNGRHLHVTRSDSPSGSPTGATPEQHNDGPPAVGEGEPGRDGARDRWGRVRRSIFGGAAGGAACGAAVACRAAPRMSPRLPSAEAVAAEPSVASRSSTQDTGQGDADTPSRSARNRLPYPLLPSVAVGRSPIPPPPAGPHGILSPYSPPAPCSPPAGPHGIRSPRKTSRFRTLEGSPKKANAGRGREGPELSPDEVTQESQPSPRSSSREALFELCLGV
ncbi:unnamed protein product [Polarella glacialis]|uniref:non-specific serine/threonine protein kinase n=1 Tax=Polarella glacialis TaxID=89957 RepID=A0A813EBY1_POLGL|nr:unnamed protein product [Polarella glacialis]